MYRVSKMIPFTALVVCVSLAPLTYGLDLKYYWKLTIPTRQDVCKDAAKADPVVVKQIQALAERYVKQIQSELMALGRRHPCLAGVGQAQIVLPGANETEKVLCGLEFMKNTHSVETAARMYQAPNRDGCVLRLWVNNIIAFPPWNPIGHMPARLLVHEIEVRANYTIGLSEENSELKKLVRDLLDKRFKEMSDEMKKLQTAEDKAADIEQ